MGRGEIHVIVTLESWNQTTFDATIFQRQTFWPYNPITMRIQWKKEEALYWGID